MVNSGTPGRTLLPSSYHRNSPASGKQGQSAAQSPAKGRGVPMQKEKRAVSNSANLSTMVPPTKKTKLSANESIVGKGKSNAASTVAAAGKASGGMARGMYLAFVDNAIAEKKQGRNQPYTELLGQFRSLSNAIPSSEATGSSSTAPSASTLKAWIEALTHVVAQLDRSHSALVDAILSLPWTSMDDPFVYAYSRFVQALLCSRSEFVGIALEKIVKAFRFQSTSTYTEKDQETDQTTRRVAYNRLHHLLSSLIHLIPTLPSTLWPIINRYFPHKRESRNCQVVYISNALKIVEYCPQLGESVLGAVILRAMQIDVEIQIDIEDLEDDEGILDEEVFGYSVENPFDTLVGDDDDSDDEDSDDEEGGAGGLEEISSDEGDSDADGEDGKIARTEEQEKEKVLSPKVIKRLKEMAAKLDAILKVIFEFLRRIVSVSSPQNFQSQPSLLSTPSSSVLSSLSSSKSNIVAGTEDNTLLSYQTGILLRRTIFDVLLHIFDEKMLKTFQTRHTQFIVFWYTALSPEFTDDFMGILMGRTTDLQGTPTITRVASAGYLASFVSRSMIIDRTSARRVMVLLLRYLEEDMEELRAAHALLSQQNGNRVRALSSSEAEKLVKNSVVFYAIAQAAFYIFCFRWKDLLDSSGDEDEEELLELEGVPHISGRRWMPEMEILKLAVSSGLNPLKFCSPNVVSQFARMAHKTDFMYCHSIIESNKRQSSSRQSRRSSDSTPRDGSPSSSISSTSTNGISKIKRPTLPAFPSSTRATRAAAQPTVDDAYLVTSTLKEAQIDSHFPFDPFKLPLSKSYMQGIYREWDSGGLDDDDEDSEEEMEEGGEIDISLAASNLGGNDHGGLSAASVESDTLTDKSLLMPPRGNGTDRLAIQGMVAGSLTSSEGGTADDADFSKSFDAMSVSPRRHSFAGH